MQKCSRCHASLASNQVLAWKGDIVCQQCREWFGSEAGLKEAQEKQPESTYPEPNAIVSAGLIFVGIVMLLASLLYLGDSRPFAPTLLLVALLILILATLMRINIHLRTIANKK